jgi:hypothetical protein
MLWACRVPGTDFGTYMCMVDDPDENVVLVAAT